MRTGRSVSGEADKEIDVRAVGVFHIIRNFGLLVNALNAFISEKSQLRNQGAKRCENGQKRRSVARVWVIAKRCHKIL